jgi:hypothetical protein
MTTYAEQLRALHEAVKPDHFLTMAEEFRCDNPRKCPICKAYSLRYDLLVENVPELLAVLEAVTDFMSVDDRAPMYWAKRMKVSNALAALNQKAAQGDAP